MAGQLPEDVFVYTCVNPITETSPFPTGCDFLQIKSSVLYPPSTGMTKDQYDELFGAVISIVVLIVIIALIKKAIEQ